MLHLLYFEFVLPWVTLKKNHQAVRIVLFLSSLFLYLVVFALGLYLWLELGQLLQVYHPFPGQVR